jgi:hypothetical protein
MKNNFPKDTIREYDNDMFEIFFNIRIQGKDVKYTLYQFTTSPKTAWTGEGSMSIKNFKSDLEGHDTWPITFTKFTHKAIELVFTAEEVERST